MSKFGSFWANLVEFRFKKSFSSCATVFQLFYCYLFVFTEKYTELTR